MVTTPAPTCPCRVPALIMRANDLTCLLCGKPVTVLRRRPERQVPGISIMLVLLGSVALLGGLLGWAIAVAGR